MKKKYDVNWNDIKLRTRGCEGDISCKIVFDSSKYVRYSESSNYFGYSSNLWSENMRFVPKNKFNLKREKELIKKIIVTKDYYNDFVLKKEVHSLG